MRVARRAKTALLAGVATIAMASCSGKDAAAPSAGTYTIAFPSTAAAVATDAVIVYVFDGGNGSAELCPSLVTARRSNQALPPSLLEAAPVSPCDLAAGRGTVTVSYGTRAVLAVAQKGAADFLIGCAVQNIGEGSTQVPVQLALATTTIGVPSTTCTSLGDHCANRCQ